MAGIVHLLLHAVAPALVARLVWGEAWLRAWLVMSATMLVDLDHFFSSTVYDANRCSIGFHPLHSGPVPIVWLAAACWRPTRLVGVGLVIHMILDGLDCIGIP